MEDAALVFFIALAGSWCVWSLTEIPERAGPRRANLVVWGTAAMVIVVGIIEALRAEVSGWSGGVFGVCLGTMWAFRAAAIRAKKAETQAP